MTSKTPRFLAKFKTVPAETSWPMDGHNVTTLSIACHCGHDDLVLEAAQSRQWKGVCTKQESITFVPPIYVNCPACRRVTLLFDPFMHGRQAEMNEVNDNNGEYKLIKCAIKPGKVFVSCAYQRLGSNSDLSIREREHPEDYFDALKVVYGDASISWHGR